MRKLSPRVGLALASVWTGSSEGLDPCLPPGTSLQNSGTHVYSEPCLKAGLDGVVEMAPHSEQFMRGPGGGREKVTSGKHRGRTQTGLGGKKPGGL